VAAQVFARHSGIAQLAHATEKWGIPTRAAVARSDSSLDIAGFHGG
jgi:hypothetical protein